jgi:hypothetical protein
VPVLLPKKLQHDHPSAFPDVAPHALTAANVPADYSAMGFNKRKMEDPRRQAAEKEAAGRGGIRRINVQFLPRKSETQA